MTKEVEEKIQNDFIKKLYDDVLYYAEVTNKTEYQPTDEERNIFGQIVILVNNISKYL